MNKAQRTQANKMIARLDALRLDGETLVDQMINAGRGNELPEETRQKTDPLSVAYMANLDARKKLRLEINQFVLSTN